MTSPNDSPESLGNTVVSICVVFGILTSIVTSLRLFTRCYVIKSVGLDDILITIAALFSWAFIVVNLMAVRHGLGTHFHDVLLRGEDNLEAYGQIIWFSAIFYNICLGFIKASVLALYTRLGDRNLRRLAIIMLVIVACQTGANVFACVFQCAPIKGAWDVTIPKKCININAFYLANSALNIVTDLLTYTLPIPLVLNLHLPTKQKAALGVMLTLGLFACISSIIRITFVPKLLKTKDWTWDVTPAMYWSVIEANIGILAASIPSFKALAKRYLPRILGEYSSSNRDGADGMEETAGATATQSGQSDDDLAKVGLRSMLSHQHSDESIGKEKDFGFGEGEMRTIVSQDENVDEGKRWSVPGGKIVATTEIKMHVSGEKI